MGKETAIYEELVHHAVDDVAVDGDANLSLQELAEDSSLDRLIQVRIVEYNEWCVAAELEVDALDDRCFGRTFGGGAADRCRAGKRNHP